MSEKSSTAWVAIASFGVLAWGCSAEVDDEREIGTQVHEDFVEDGASGDSSQADVAGRIDRALVASTVDGHWAIVDAATGAVRSSVPAGPQAFLRDAVIDPWFGRLLAFEAYEDEWGEIVSYPLGLAMTSVEAPPPLGDRDVLGWLTGDARLLSSPHGPVLFEFWQGSRWRLMPSEGGFAASRVAAPPRSVWAWQDGGGLWLEALTYGTPGQAAQLEVASGVVDGQGLSDVTAAPLPVSAAHTLDTSARMVPASWLGGAVLADVTGAGVSVWSLPWCAVDADCSPDAGWVIPIEGQRLEQIVALPELETVALLMSAPAQLVTVRLPSSTAVSYDVLALPGEVRVEARFFSRDMLAHGAARLLVATEQGVIAADVTTASGDVHVALDPVFEGAGLRGPLAGFPATGL